MNDDRQGPMLVALFLGVLYRDAAEQAWQGLLDLQASARDECGVIGAELILDKAEGHAHLRQRPPAPDAPELPRLVLVQRHPLSFPVSLVLGRRTVARRFRAAPRSLCHAC